MTFFVYHRPVAGRREFAGRDSLVRSLAQGFVSHRSFAVCGGPLTGRTSTLNHVTLLIHERWRRVPAETKVVPVTLDLADWSRVAPRLVPELLWGALLPALTDPRVAGEAGPPEAPRTDFRRTRDPWGHLFELLEDLFSRMRGTSAWCEYGLLVDNADWLFDPRLDVIQPMVIDFVKMKESWSPRSVTFAGGRYLREHLLDPRAPLAFLRPMLLGPLREDEAERLVRAGLPEIDPELSRTLLSATGRHPYALARVAAELEARGLEIGVEAAVDAAAQDCLALFARIWNELDLDRGVTYRGAYAAPEHALLQLLIDYQQGCDLRTAERELGIRPLKEYAELLEYLGIVERVIQGNEQRLRPHFELWNIWYGERILS